MLRRIRLGAGSRIGLLGTVSFFVRLLMSRTDCWRFFLLRMKCTGFYVIC